MNQPSEAVMVVGKIDRQTANNTTKTIDIVDMSKFAEALAIFLIGTVDATTDFKLQESNASDFSSGVSDIAGKAITQFTATDDNKVAVVNLKAEEMTKRYLRGLATLGNGTSQAIAVVILGVKPRY